MGIVNCPNCGESFLAPGVEDGGKKVCVGCETSLQSRLNEIDREYTMKDMDDLSERDYRDKKNEMHKEKVNKVKFALSDIPPKHLSPTLAQMAEEIIDPDIRDRSFCIGTLDEIHLGDNGVELRSYYDPTE